MNKKAIQCVWAIILIVTTTHIQAQNKVVVIPLFGDEAPTSKTVFLTKGTWRGNFGGPIGADDLCQAEADAKGSKVQGKSFKAWISGGLPSGFELGSRYFNRSDLPYTLVDGTIIASNYADLVDGGPLSSPINMHANGDFIATPIEVWTGIKSTGFFHPESCQDWTSAESSDDGLIGSNVLDAVDWTESELVDCDFVAWLFCFEQ